MQKTNIPLLRFTYFSWGSTSDIPYVLAAVQVCFCVGSNEGRFVYNGKRIVHKLQAACDQHQWLVFWQPLMAFL